MNADQAVVRFARPLRTYQMIHRYGGVFPGQFKFCLKHSNQWFPERSHLHPGPGKFPVFHHFQQRGKPLRLVLWRLKL